MNACPQKREEIKTVVALELSLKSDDHAIQEFLRKYQIVFSFDHFVNRYQGIIRDIKNPPGIDCAVVVYIYVDKERKFLSSEVVASYTGM